jgi:hypothetical protein
MGDRYTLLLNCAYCKSKNEDIYYAPTCGFYTFKCEECGLDNFITADFKSMKLENVKIHMIKYGFIGATNQNWTTKQINKHCEEVMDNIRKIIKEKKDEHKKKKKEEKERAKAKSC